MPMNLQTLMRARRRRSGGKASWTSIFDILISSKMINISHKKLIFVSLILIGFFVLLFGLDQYLHAKNIFAYQKSTIPGFFYQYKPHIQFPATFYEGVTVQDGHA